MRASRVLYNLGIPALLKGTIALKTEMMIYSFSCFMLTKSSRARSPYLRRLEMCTPGLSDEPEQIVSVIRESAAAILEQATHLEYLMFWTCYPLIDVENPSVITALASITTLRCLDFHNPEKAQKGIEEAFQDTSSPLSELIVQGFNEEKLWNNFPQNLLGSVKESLTKLALSVDPSFLSTTLFQLPRVEELCLHFTHPFSLESLPRVFPNLKRLTLDAFYASEKLKGPEVQELLFRKQKSPYKWSSLDYIRADAKALLCFGPTCAIREVRVDYLDSRWIDPLCQFLRTAKPSVLHIDIWFENPVYDLPLLLHTISTNGQLDKLVLSFYLATGPVNSSRDSDAWVRSGYHSWIGPS
ncbi:hypothetical protein NLI96_g72 [Meripilus lineatus]|uniref:Uncharacterized protein n=1 Tax=Meripilus lineatus TaxID=2056292 RepID=A0AAD5VD82_9APHY|nr:hypothetical protein NLI96_g72 [Physisporinus lineatus]